MAQRRTGDQLSQPSHLYPYGATTPSSYGTPQPVYSSFPATSQKDDTSKKHSHYKHNLISLSFLLPTLASILWWHESAVVIEIFLFMALILYALDLINSRDAVAVCLWIAALILTMASGFGMLLQVDDAEATGASSIFYLLRLAVDGMLFCAMVCTHSFNPHGDVPVLQVALFLTSIIANGNKGMLGDIAIQMAIPRSTVDCCRNGAVSTFCIATGFGIYFILSYSQIAHGLLGTG